MEGTMARYEGMDRLLQGVRERIEAGQSRAQVARSEHPLPLGVSVRDVTLDSMIGSLGILLREAQELREMVVSTESYTLSEEQRDRVLTLLGQVLEELWTCEASLQGVS
jgi:hypothetical protein